MASKKLSPSMSATDLDQQLTYLRLPFIHQHYQPLAQDASQNSWSHLDYLAKLINGEASRRQDKSIERRIHRAHFPLIKTLDQFQWSWPTKINKLQIQNVFHLNFLKDHTNVTFVGGVGLGKTHLAIALGHTACLNGYSVLFTSTVDAINSLYAAQTIGRLKQELLKYLKPQLLILDELGYLPIDKTGADLLFQIISQRYERGSTVITTNRAFKKWPEIFNNDATLTSAILDRLLHHVENVVLFGKSYRMKDAIENNPIIETQETNQEDLDINEENGHSQENKQAT